MRLDRWDADASTMWHVTTSGDLPDDYEQRDYQRALWAWDDYQGRILELEICGFTRTGEEATEHGRRWVSTLCRGVERMSVAIERA